jgi:hypothetical protein
MSGKEKTTSSSLQGDGGKMLEEAMSGQSADKGKERNGSLKVQGGPEPATTPCKKRQREGRRARIHQMAIKGEECLDFGHFNSILLSHSSNSFPFQISQSSIFHVKFKYFKH